MDSLACEMAITWVTGPATGGHPWLPFGGATASAYVQSRHETRYQPGQGLGAEDAKLRRAAREARRRLAVAFHRNGLAQSEDEGKRLARTFSIVANAYGECRQLKRLGERLQSLLLSQAREHRTGEVAMACLEFLESHDFSSLENDLVRYAAA
jgi:hypothetical protein